MAGGWWVQFPAALMASPDLTPGAKLILASIRDRTRAGGSIHLSARALAAAVGLGTDAVLRGVRELVGAGLLHHAPPAGKLTRGQASRYSLTADAVALWAGAETARPRADRSETTDDGEPSIVRETRTMEPPPPHPDRPGNTDDAEPAIVRVSRTMEPQNANPDRPGFADDDRPGFPDDDRPGFPDAFRVRDREVPPSPPDARNADPGSDPVGGGIAREESEAALRELLAFGVSAAKARELAGCRTLAQVRAAIARAKSERWGPGLLVEQLSAAELIAAAGDVEQRQREARLRREQQRTEMEAEYRDWFATFTPALRAVCRDRARRGPVEATDFEAVCWFRTHGFGPTGLPDTHRPMRIGEFLERRRAAMETPAERPPCRPPAASTRLPEAGRKPARRAG